MSLRDSAIHMLRMRGSRDSAVIYWWNKAWGPELLYVDDVMLQCLSSCVLMITQLEGLSCHMLMTYSLGAWAVVCWWRDAWRTQLSCVKEVRLEGLSCYMLRMWGLRNLAVICWGCEAWGSQLLYIEDVRLEGLSCYMLKMWSLRDSAVIHCGCETQQTQLL